MEGAGQSIVGDPIISGLARLYQRGKCAGPRFCLVRRIVLRKANEAGCRRVREGEGGGGAVSLGLVGGTRVWNQVREKRECSLRGTGNKSDNGQVVTKKDAKV